MIVNEEITLRHEREEDKKQRGDRMRVTYKGPQGQVEVHGVGVFERGKAVDVDDELAQDLLGNELFEVVKIADKPKKEKDE